MYTSFVQVVDYKCPHVEGPFVLFAPSHRLPWRLTLCSMDVAQNTAQNRYPGHPTLSLLFAPPQSPKAPKLVSTLHVRQPKLWPRFPYSTSKYPLFHHPKAPAFRNVESKVAFLRARTRGFGGVGDANDRSKYPVDPTQKNRSSPIQKNLVGCTRPLDSVLI